ncbi:MAG TPA: ATP-binding protein [Myxococcaceae bacterium]|nr:ATP-binding protein [Myxococcaceae bacterium]
MAVALRVQRARTVQAVLDEAAGGLHALGFHACVVRSGNPAGQVASIRTAEEIRALLEPPTGRAEHLQLAPSDHAALQQLIDEARPRLIDDVAPAIRGLIARQGGQPEDVISVLDAAGIRTVMIAPLVVDGVGWGALVLAAARLTSEDVAALALFTAQVACAIEVSQSMESVERRQLRPLLENSQVITGSLELEQILAASAQGLVGMIDATDAFIWFLEENELRGVVCSSPEFQEHFAKVRLPLSDSSAVGLAIHARSPVRIEDTARSPDVHQEINSVYRQKSVLALPLMLREVAIGAISIGDRRRTRRFSDDEMERALLMSRQVAVAIDNARLFQDLKRSYTELSRAQQELVKRERLAALGELSAVVAHEVRNPLGVIFNSLASLRRLGPGDDDARMLLSIVGEEAERLNRMVSDLLDFARPHDPRLRPEPLAEILVGAVEAAKRAMTAGQVTFAVEVAPELPPIWVDADMIRQAMVNLVTNAVQAMPRGGMVTVRASPELRGIARFARVEVQDEGPGIAPELADRVFQPFFTTKAAGTGLGLAVVKRIADAHRAEVAVRSMPGRGSTFILWLPA